jgi:hypothetical protein
MNGPRSFWLRESFTCQMAIVTSNMCRSRPRGAVAARDIDGWADSLGSELFRAEAVLVYGRP